MDQLRIFISSPGDVNEERRRAAIVIQRIRREFSRFFDVSAILWEYDPMLSSGHFQDVIEKPSNTDIVVLILWSRLGTALPERYRGIDGRAPVTGTEWEFEDALAARRLKGSPDLLVYRKNAPPQAAFTDSGQMQRAQAQWDLLQDFWLRHFVERDGTFKAAFNQFGALDDFEHQLEMHLRALLRERVGKLLKAEGKTPIAWHAGSPFRGLSVFGPEHAAIFFGREKAEQELVEILARRADDGTAFVCIFGASGSGKSSLLRAGVLPTVESPGVVAGVTRWRRLLFTPAELGGDPFAGLAGRLLSGEVLPEASASGDGVAWRRLLSSAPQDAAGRIRDALARAAQDAGLTGGALPLRLFLLVDQLEEIFTSPSFTPEDRIAFIAVLAALAKSGAVWVAATLRSDFFPRLAEIEALAALTAGAGGYALAAPRGAEIERMIGKPAEAAGIAFEVDPRTGIGLDGELLDAASAAPGALPLMEFTLDELYRRDIQTRGGDFLTFATFRTLGGLEGAIAAQAEASVGALPQREADALPVLVRALVQVGEDNRIGARAAPMDELQARREVGALTDALVQARLLIVSGATVRVAHEALLRAWPRAAALIAEDMELLRTRARAEQAMTRWLAEKEAADFLLPRGRSLAEAQELLAARRDEMGADLVRFIEAAAAADEARRQAELASARARAEAEAEAARQREQRAIEQAAAAHRLTRRTRLAAAILSVLLAVAVGAGIFATLQRAQAVRQRNAALVSQSHFLADAASAAIEAGDARLGRLLALAALPRILADPDRPYVPAAEAALAQSWTDDRLLAIAPSPPPAKPAAKPAAAQPAGRNARLAQLLRTVTNTNLSFAVAPQGGRMAIAGEGHARVYDQQGNPLLDAVHAAYKGAIALDRTGKLFAQGEGNAVRLWDLEARTSRLLGGLASGDAAERMAFAPDGKTLTVGGRNGGVAVFVLPQGAPLAMPGISGETQDVRVSPDSRHVAVTGADGRAGLYDLVAGKVVAVLGEAAQAQGDITSRFLRQGLGFMPKFSEDGTLVVTATGDTRVQLWDTATGRPVGAAMAHAGAVQSFEFGKDRLEVTLLDGRKYLWATHSPGEARRIWAHAGAISLSPDGSEILITDASGLFVINAAGQRVRGLLTQAGLSGGAVSPDGKTVVVTANGTDVILIPFAGGSPRTVYRAPAADRIGFADFTSNSGRLVVQRQSYAAVMLDPATGRTIATLGDGKQRSLGFIAHSDDMVAAWDDGRTLLYRPDGGSQAIDTPRGANNLNISRIVGNGDAGLLASVGRTGSALFFWDMKTGKVVGRADDRQSFGAFAAAFNPGPGGWIARGSSDQNILVWAWPGAGLPDIVGAPLKRLTGHSGIIRRMRVTAQGRLMTEAEDHAAILWDPLHGHAIARYDGVMDSRLSADGNRFVYIGADGAVRVAQLPPSGQALIDAARARHGELGADERDRFFLSEQINRR